MSVSVAVLYISTSGSDSADSVSQLRRSQNDSLCQYYDGDCLPAE